MEKLLISIKPRRFVYHVSPRKNRKSINQHGLKTSSNYGILDFQNAVFANNTAPGILWFPLVMHLFEEFSLEGYDIWRIDTYKINHEWFIDYRCPTFKAVTGLDHDVHIHTHNAIPRFALDLFIVEDFRIYFSQSEGVAHYHTLGGFTEKKLKKINL